MPWQRPIRSVVILTWLCVVMLLSSADAGARPNGAELRGQAQQVLPVRATPNPCDELWRFLDARARRLEPATAVVSIRTSYALAGLSTLATVRAQETGHFFLSAPLMQDGSAAMGHVDVRLGRRPNPSRTGYDYSVRVRTCPDGERCAAGASHLASPRECTIRRDAAILVVPGESRRQEVTIRFQR